MCFLWKIVAFLTVVPQPRSVLPASWTSISEVPNCLHSVGIQYKPEVSLVLPFNRLAEGQILGQAPWILPHQGTVRAPSRKQTRYTCVCLTANVFLSLWVVSAHMTDCAERLLMAKDCVFQESQELTRDEMEGLRQFGTYWWELQMGNELETKPKQ